jgi:hypothetical protein
MLVRVQLPELCLLSSVAERVLGKDKAQDRYLQEAPSDRSVSGQHETLPRS